MSSYDENQKSEFIQKTNNEFKYITGLWRKPNGCLKSGRINKEGFQNLEAFGERTILIINENKARRKNSGAPDFTMVAVEDYAK